jgi:hypothetical protein
LISTKFSDSWIDTNYDGWESKPWFDSWGKGLPEKQREGPFVVRIKPMEQDRIERSSTWGRATIVEKAISVKPSSLYLRATAFGIQ